MTPPPTFAPEPADLLLARPLPAAKPVAVWNKTWVRRVHAVVGLVSSLNLLLLLSTGFLLQHRDTLGLDERAVSRRLLPANYRPQDGPEGVRADIVVADLHSGRMFGRTGALILDGLTLGWLALLVTGIFLYSTGRLRKENGSARNGTGWNGR